MKKFYLGLFILGLGCSNLPTKNLSPLVTEQIGKIGFLKHPVNKDLTYYYLPSMNNTDPLLVVIQGSGCDSVFRKDATGVIVSNLGMLRPLKDKVAILAVEKPGVETFAVSDDNKMYDCGSHFRETFTLDRWADTILNAIRDVRQRYDLKPSKVVVQGHSEGSDVAALVASQSPTVSHVLYMSGGAGSPVFHSLLSAIARGNGDAKKIENNIKTQSEVWIDGVKMGDPDHLMWGHPLRYWRSRAKLSIAQLLNQTKAKILIVYGTQDTNSPSVTTELLFADLAELARPYEFRRVDGGDHAYTVKGVNNMEKIMLESRDWAIKPQ